MERNSKAWIHPSKVANWACIGVQCTVGLLLAAIVWMILEDVVLR